MKRCGALDVQLADAVWGELERRGEKDMRALDGLGNRPQALWKVVIKEVAEEELAQGVWSALRLSLP